MVEAEIKKEDEDRNFSYAIKKSASLQSKLKRKRFKQVFEFLDEQQLGLIDLVSIVNNNPVMMDVLDDEVRNDVDAAARLYVKGMHRATGRSYDDDNADDEMVYPPIDLEKFYQLMEEALASRRCVRALLSQ